MTVQRFRWFTASTIVLLAFVGVLVLLDASDGEPPMGSAAPQRPLSRRIVADVETPPSIFRTREVSVDVEESRAFYNITPEFRSAVEGFEATQKPKTKTSPHARGVGMPLADVALAEGSDARAPTAIAPQAPAGSGQVASFESTDFLDNIATTGNIFIPADPQGAAGPNQVMSVTNTTAAVHDKTGGLVGQESLAGFFAPLAPLTFTFDPRVIYDEHNGRWLLLTTEVTDTEAGFASDTSRIFLAVSDDDNPSGDWSLIAIDAVTSSFSGGATREHWVDFPQIAVDEEAIYITGTIFSFFVGPNAFFGGIRLWVVDKGDGTGGFYDDGFTIVDQYDPLPAPAIVTGGAPAMVFGTPASSTFGTYVVNYSGISDGVNEAIQIVRVDNPLGTPTFTPSLILVGNIHDTGIGLPAAPQSGSATRITTNDSRVLKAVWRENNLWTTFSITPNVGDPERGQAVVHWIRMSVADTPLLGEQGRVSGEDIAVGVHTFFPSIAVNDDLDVMVSFAASGASIFPGAYYAVHDADAPAGSTGPSMVLRAGIDSYVRTFGGGLNRWGDFSSAAVDPADQCFWVYNKYAALRGTPTGGEDGRWGTRFAKFCNVACAGVPDPVTHVAGTNEAGTVFSWDDLGPGFTYDIALGSISVLRSGGAVGPMGCLMQGGADPTATDSLPDPPGGEGRFFLIRARSTCEIGDYGTDSDGVLRVPTPGCTD